MEYLQNTKNSWRAEMEILDGKLYSKELRLEIKEKAEKFFEKYNRGWLI